MRAPQPPITQVQTYAWRLCAALPLLCAAPALHAQPSPEMAATAATAPIDCAAPELLALPADSLHQHLHQCERNASYLLQLGRLRNQQGQYEQAADHLERALLLEPDAPAALLQYAIALAGSGDTLSALHLMTDLQQRPDLTAPLRASLSQVVASWGARLQTPIWAHTGAAAPGHSTSLVASTRLGYDSNLRGSSPLSSLTLTLPGESVTLPIEPAQLPRGASVLQNELRASHQRRLPSGARWGVQAAVQQRYAPSLQDASSTQAEWQMDYTAAPATLADDAIKTKAKNITENSPDRDSRDSSSWAPWVSAGIVTLRSRSGTRYTSHSLSLGVERAAQDCALRWGLDGQNRQLRNNPILSGHYLGASLQWHCNRAPAGLQWLAVLRLGQDRASQAARPGGHQNQIGLRVHASLPAPGLWQPARWVVDADYSHSRDAQGYSPLLDNARVRQIQRATARLEWQQTLRPGVHAIIGAEAVNQNASLPLFQMRSHGVWLGLRGQW